MAYYAVIRVRGRTGIKPQIKRAMELLNLTRINHCVIIKDSPQHRGMLQKCKDYITWGEVNEQTLAKIIEKRGRLSGDKRIEAALLKEKGFEGFDQLAAGFLAGSAGLKDAGVKKVFRLHPPKRGYKVIKQSYPRGALGYRGEAINALLKRMV